MSAALLGVPVTESKHAPKDAIWRLRDPMTGMQWIVVNDAWQQITWPLFLHDQRELIRRDLAAIVAAAHRRLFGSEPRDD